REQPKKQTTPSVEKYGSNKMPQAEFAETLKRAPSARRKPDGLTFARKSFRIFVTISAGATKKADSHCGCLLFW
ncbi:MAG TPA: hypothetical protein DDW54_04410, partial [Clostridiales bacterium]|nr:hypothetical protein [Clostridiales bacterium]